MYLASMMNCVIFVGLRFSWLNHTGCCGFANVQQNLQLPSSRLVTLRGVLKQKYNSHIKQGARSDVIECFRKLLGALWTYQNIPGNINAVYEESFKHLVMFLLIVISQTNAEDN
jgi:hypothetical protein